MTEQERELFESSNVGGLLSDLFDGEDQGPLLTLFYSPEDVEEALKRLGKTFDRDELLVTHAAQAAVHVMRGGRLQVREKKRV